MPETEELKFATEEEKVNKLNELQDSETTDLELIQKVREAPIESSGESETPEGGAETPTDAGETVSQEPEGEHQEVSEPEGRQDDPFSAIGFEVPKDTYFEDGREKPLFPFKDPKSALESIPHAQRHIQYLEKKRLPEVYNQGYEKAKAELGAQIQYLQKQVEERKQATPDPKGEQSQATSTYLQGLEELKKVDPNSDDYDPVAHVQKLQEVVSTSAQAMSDLQKQNQNLADQFATFPETTASKTQEMIDAAVARVRQEPKAGEADSQWKQTAKEVDEFARSINVQLDEGYADKTKEVQKFHIRLAQLGTGKYEISNRDIRDTVSAYLRGDQQLVNAAREAGVQPPTGYDRWNYLDQVDALRSGLIRHPQTKQWVKAKDAYGEDLTFSDLNAAAAYYDRVTGKTDQELTQARKESASKVVDAMGRRDKNVVSADMSKSLDSGEGSEVTQKEAAEKLQSLSEQYDMDDIMQQVFGGNFAVFDTMNDCRKKLGMGELALPAGVDR